MTFEQALDQCKAVIVEIFPNLASRFDGLEVIHQDVLDSSVLFYDTIKHTILTTPKAIGEISLVAMGQFHIIFFDIMHELTHAMSFSDAQEHSGGAPTIHTGLQINSEKKGKKISTGRDLNETLTDFFGLYFLIRMFGNSPEAASLMGEHENTFINVDMLSGMVGGDIINEAYFKGKRRQLRKALQKIGTKESRVFLGALNKVVVFS